MTKNQFIVLLVTTFIVVVTWIVADIIHTKPSVPVDPKLQSSLEPIDPKFNQTILDQIRQNQIPISVETVIQEKNSTPSVTRNR